MTMIPLSTSICRARRSTASAVAALAAIATMAAVTAAAAMPPSDMAASYSARAGTPADAARGERFFTAGHGREWRCATCHGAMPTSSGRHAATGRSIAPLAPAFHAGRLTDPAKVEKWFKRNCNDVLGRECTAGEKADLLAWLISLKP
jgi:hypothetical protein